MDHVTIQPVWARFTHWNNALAVVLMVMSGWQIYHASPMRKWTERRVPRFDTGNHLRSQTGGDRAKSFCCDDGANPGLQGRNHLECEPWVDLQPDVVARARVR